MDSLYLLQFGSLIFMVINAAIVAMGYLYTKWENKRYERSRLMIFAALVGLAIQYYIQMEFGLRATDDDLGAVVNMLIYTPCFTLISMGIYNIEATHAHRRRMNLVCAAIYAAIIAAFAIGYLNNGSYRIGGWLYVMLAFYSASVVYCVLMISREMIRRKTLLETMTASDMVPYVRYSRTSIVTLSLAALIMPFAILSTSLLFIVGPVVLSALLFFNLSFISLGSSYIPTEELIDSDEDSKPEPSPSLPAADGRDEIPARDSSAEAQRPPLSAERVSFIRSGLDLWCNSRGYRDSAVNLMTLSRSLNVSKGDLSQYFDQYLHATFRVWLSDIRFKAAQTMMQANPDYSNDVISAECGFSSRTQLYRIFKSKTGSTPNAWRSNL